MRTIFHVRMRGWVLRAILLLVPLTVGLSQMVTNRPPKVVRLHPKAFPELPDNLLRELNRRSCRVPQPPPYEHRRNIIRGEFAKPGQVDWAVLCSRGPVTRILVFWNGSEKDPSEVLASRGVPYDWAIGVAEKDFLVNEHRTDERALPVLLEHQGIVVSTDTDVRIMVYDGNAWRTVDHRVMRIY